MATWVECDVREPLIHWLLSDSTKGLYEDKWHGDVLHYTGMGKKGDQDLNGTQNKTLYESRTNGIEVHLFEVFQGQVYTYMGQVELVSQPYDEIQKDEDGIPRKVWMFPVKIISSDSEAVDESLLEIKYEEKEKIAKRLDDLTLKSRAEESQSTVTSRRSTSTTRFERNAYVSEYAKRRAQGRCQLCERPAPFLDREHKPFLETHHIIWLSRGGADTIDNTVALCPNCHRKTHIINNKSDIQKLKSTL